MPFVAMPSDVGIAIAATIVLMSVPILPMVVSDLLHPNRLSTFCYQYLYHGDEERKRISLEFVFGAHLFYLGVDIRTPLDPIGVGEIHFRSF